MVVGTGPNTAIGKIRRGCGPVPVLLCMRAWCTDRKLCSCSLAETARTFPEEMGALCRDAMAETVEELTPLKQKLEDFGQFLSKARRRSRIILYPYVLVPQSQAVCRYSPIVRTRLSCGCVCRSSQASA